MKNNKKGFTLVELLAVIAILAILIIIALPNILKMFNDAQMKLFLQEARNINKAAEDSYLAHKMGTTTPTETIYTYVDGEESSIGNIKMKLSGQKPKNGQLVIMSDGQTSLAFHNGKYCVTKSFGSDEVMISDVPEEECIVSSVTSSSCFVTYIDPYCVIPVGKTEVAIYDYYSWAPGCSQDVIIPSKINGKTVTAIGEYAFREKDLTSVTIPNTVTSIGSGAFQNNQLTSVIIPTSLETLVWDVFSNNQLTSIMIPSTLTSIDGNPFNHNPALTDITVDSANPEYMSSNNAVYTKDGEMLVLGTKNASNNILNTTTTIGYNAFYGMGLTSVTIPTNVRNIESSAFSENELTTVLIPEGIEVIESNAFENNLIESISFPSTLKTISAGVFRSNKLKTLVIPNTVTTIEDGSWWNGAFAYNELTSLTLSSNLTHIGESAFYSNNITSIVIPNKVKTIGPLAFYGNQLTSVTIPNSVTSIGGWAFSRNRIAQGNFRIDNTSGGVTIGSYALYYNGTNGSTTITPTYLR